MVGRCLDIILSPVLGLQTGSSEEDYGWGWQPNEEEPPEYEPPSIEQNLGWTESGEKITPPTTPRPPPNGNKGWKPNRGNNINISGNLTRIYAWGPKGFPKCTGHHAPNHGRSMSECLSIVFFCH